MGTCVIGPHDTDEVTWVRIPPDRTEPGNVGDWALPYCPEHAPRAALTTDPSEGEQ